MQLVMSGNLLGQVVQFISRILISGKEKLSLMSLHNTLDRERLIFKEIHFDIRTSSQAVDLLISPFSV